MLRFQTATALRAILSVFDRLDISIQRARCEETYEIFPLDRVGETEENSWDGHESQLYIIIRVELKLPQTFYPDIL